MDILRVLKGIVREVLGGWEDDMTRTYRPIRDWSVPLHRLLDQLPSEALDPPGVRGRRLARGGRATKKPKRSYSPADTQAEVSTAKRGKQPK
jgi:hypothetical protein